MSFFYCAEPALLEQDTTVLSSLSMNAIKYYKYWVANLTGPLTVQLHVVEGQTMFQVSLVNKNPRKSLFNWNVCSIGGVTKSTPALDINQMGNDSVCFSNPNGFVSWPVEQNGGRTKLIGVRKCRSEWLYVSVEGVKAGTNRFNLTLVNDTINLGLVNDTTNTSLANDSVVLPAQNMSSNRSLGSDMVRYSILLSNFVVSKMSEYCLQTETMVTDIFREFYSLYLLRFTI